MNFQTNVKLTIVALTLTFCANAATPSTLADAAERHDQAGVRALLRASTGVNTAQADGTTALHWTAYHDDAETTALLIKAGADVNVANRFGLSPLAQACKNGNAAIVKLLLDAGANVNTSLKGGETVLMLAARSGNAEAAQMLLSRRADPNARERLGQTALMWAAAEGHTGVIQALLKAGADINAKIGSGFTPFLFAVREGRLDAARALISAGIDVNEMMTRPADEPGPRPTSSGRTTPLALAVQNGHFELALALIDAGANPNDERTGFAPLHMLPGVRKPDSSDVSDGAAPNGAGKLSSLDFVREIVMRGANVNLRLAKGGPRMPATSSSIASEGATPLLYAADRSDVPLMRLLLELGADPLLGNASGTTPLMAAAGVGTKEAVEEAGEEGESLEAVTMLLERGANINGVDNNGDTPMHGAASNNYPRVIQLLAERGADPKIWSKPNRTGRTPLFIAEGYVGAELRPNPPTIAAITQLMHAAGLSTEGKRPEIVDSYAPVQRPRSADRAK